MCVSVTIVVVFWGSRAPDYRLKVSFPIVTNPGVLFHVYWQKCDISLRQIATRTHQPCEIVPLIDLAEFHPL